MNIQISIPDGKKDKIINAFVIQYGYQATLEDGSDNPQSKAEFAKQKLIEFVKEVYKASKVKEAETTKQNLRDEADNYTKDLTIS